MAVVKAVFLDIDGTLMDTNYLHIEAWAQAFEEVGAPAKIEDSPRGGQGFGEAHYRVCRRRSEGRADQRTPQRVLRQAAGTRAPLARCEGTRSLVGRGGLRGLVGHQR